MFQKLLAQEAQYELSFLLSLGFQKYKHLHQCFLYLLLLQMIVLQTKYFQNHSQLWLCFFSLIYSVPFEEGIMFFILSSTVSACFILLANDLKHDSIM